jgi:hypothetical protein
MKTNVQYPLAARTLPRPRIALEGSGELPFLGGHADTPPPGGIETRCNEPRRPWVSFPSLAQVKHS